MALLGETELTVAGPCPEAVEHGEDGRAPLGPVRAEGTHLGLVGRIEVRDDRVDRAPIDAAARVDVVHEEVDRLHLFAILRVSGETEPAREGTEVCHRELDVDGVRSDSSRSCWPE